jgi:hypothetical protein
VRGPKYKPRTSLIWNKMLITGSQSSCFSRFQRSSLLGIPSRLACSFVFRHPVRTVVDVFVFTIELLKPSSCYHSFHKICSLLCHFVWKSGYSINNVPSVFAVCINAVLKLLNMAVRRAKQTSRPLRLPLAANKHSLCLCQDMQYYMYYCYFTVRILMV